MIEGDLADSLVDMRQIKGSKAGHIPSLSGNERNPLFINKGGKSFEDISLISGADSEKDGRSAVLWDFDSDGFQDIAVVNANAPRLAIYKNQLGKKFPDNRHLKIQLTGAKGKSNRDGYGTVIKAQVGNKIFRAEHQCGTGFAAQNSATMHIGLGSVEKIDTLTVLWPSGTKQVFTDVPSNQVLKISENSSILAQTTDTQ